MEESQLAKALAEVQTALPKIDKGKIAEVAMKTGGKYSYKYADLSDISEKILPLLGAKGLAWVACPTVLDTGRFILAYSLRHASGECIEGSYPLPNPDGRPQDTGSAITYARRYALCSVVGVVPDEDDDGQGAEQAYSRAHSNRQEPKARSGAGAKTNTSSAAKNLQTLMIKELQGEQRLAFLKWFGDNLPNESLTAVPIALQGTVEAAINSFACGEVPASMEEPF